MRLQRAHSAESDTEYRGTDRERERIVKGKSDRRRRRRRRRRRATKLSCVLAEYSPHSSPFLKFTLFSSSFTFQLFARQSHFDC